MALLVNKSNLVVEVDDLKRIEELLASGFTKPTKEQEREYLRKHNKKKITGGVGVYFRPNNNNPHGYGQSTAPLVYSIEDAGIPVSHTFTGQNIGIVYSYPQPLEALETDIKVLYSMFESTKIDPAWLPYLRMADYIYVPSKFCQEAFLSRGIKTEVIPLGYNQELFYYKEKEDDGVFTFTMYNAFDMRKGWDILFGAFVEEFGKQEDIKLILKSVNRNLPFPIVKSEYPNIEVVLESVSQESLRDLLYKTDCFVFPSRGEGFGLPPLEALACGTTAIIPNGSGMSEYFNNDYFIEVEIERLRPAIYEHFDINVVGEMIEPSKKDLRKKLRWAYENREKCWEMGKKGAMWVRDNYAIRNTGVRFASELKRIGVKVNEVRDVVITNPLNRVKSVAFFLKNRDMYSGGRIFCYQIIHALCELGYDVTIYTNMKPKWESELKWCGNYNTVIVPDVEKLKSLEVDADIYMGAVQEGNIACVRNAIRTNNRAFAFVFDPIPMIEKYDSDRLGSEKDGYFEVEKLINESKETTPVLLTEFAKETCKDYFKNESKILQPCVNDLEANKHEAKREDIIIASAMTGERDKGFESALKVFSLTPKNWVFHIFTSRMNSRLEEWIHNYNLKDRVVAHYDKPDSEKYEMYARAKIMLCPSPYEGYGMWLAEGRYMGLECVVVDSGAIREVAGGDSHVHIAERDNGLDLANKLEDAMKVKVFKKRRSGFGFNKLVSNLEELLK